LAAAGISKKEKVTLSVQGDAITVLKRDSKSSSTGCQADSANIPEEINAWESLHEGAVCSIKVNSYERNAVARRRCIDHYGAKCCICRRPLKDFYGDVADGLVHVHHLKPLSRIGRRYEVDLIKDLRPVCPNCHAVLHLRDPAYGLDEVREFIRRARRQ
jgi:5-methylcytosine-specific restriction protein A